MTENSETKKVVPPYLPFRTLATFIESLKGAMPQRIDRSLMKSMSGGMQSQLISALEYLQLISPDTGIPTDNLNRLAHSDKEDRASVLRETLTSSYRFLFENELELERATPDQLQERFRQAGVSGDTLRKAVAFFLKAAKEAGLKLSPHFKRTYTRRSPSSKGKRKTDLAQEPGGLSDQKDSSVSPNKDALPGGDTLLSKLADKILDKFPDFDPSWTPEQQASWFEGMNKLMTQFEKK